MDEIRHVSRPGDQPDATGEPSMPTCLYHGSVVPGITELEARSTLRGSDARVVYLTGNVPYALYYIWDAAHNGCAVKHVTGWIKDGVACYEEQFPHQLRTFYQGVSGHLYHVLNGPRVHAVQGRDSLYYIEGAAPVAQDLFIPDVYEEMLRYETLGQLRILRYLEQSPRRQRELTDLIAEAIRRVGFFQRDESQARFFKRYFPQAWEKAEA